MFLKSCCRLKDRTPQQKQFLSAIVAKNRADEVDRKIAVQEEEELQEQRRREAVANRKAEVLGRMAMRADEEAMDITKYRADGDHRYAEILTMQQEMFEEQKKMFMEHSSKQNEMFLEHSAKQDKLSAKIEDKKAECKALDLAELEEIDNSSQAATIASQSAKKIKKAKENIQRADESFRLAKLNAGLEEEDDDCTEPSSSWTAWLSSGTNKRLVPSSQEVAKDRIQYFDSFPTSDQEEETKQEIEPMPEGYNLVDEIAQPDDQAAFSPVAARKQPPAATKSQGLFSPSRLCDRLAIQNLNNLIFDRGGRSEQSALTKTKSTQGVHGTADKKDKILEGGTSMGLLTRIKNPKGKGFKYFSHGRVFEGEKTRSVWNGKAVRNGNEIVRNGKWWLEMGLWLLEMNWKKLKNIV